VCIKETKCSQSKREKKKTQWINVCQKLNGRLSVVCSFFFVQFMTIFKYKKMPFALFTFFLLLSCQRNKADGITYSNHILGIMRVTWQRRVVDDSTDCQKKLFCWTCESETPVTFFVVVDQSFLI